MCWGNTPKGERLLFLRAVPKDLYSLNHLSAYDWKEKTTRELEGSDGEPFERLHLLGCSPNLSRLLIYREHAGRGDIEVFPWDGDMRSEMRLAPAQEHWTLPEGTWVSGFLVGPPDWFTLRHDTGTTLYRWENGSDPVPILDLKGHVYNLRRGKSANEILAIAGLDGRDEVWDNRYREKNHAKSYRALRGNELVRGTKRRFSHLRVIEMEDTISPSPIRSYRRKRITEFPTQATL